MAAKFVHSHGNKLSKTVRWTLGILLLFIGILLATSGIWILRNFGSISVSQALMNMQGTAGNEGATSFVRSFIFDSLIVAALLTAALTLAFAIFLRWPIAHGKAPIRRSTAILIGTIVPIVALTTGGAQFDKAVNVSGYLNALSSNLDLGDYYANPELTTAPSKNLVLIYLESMDDAYGDADLVGYDALTALKNATSDWEKLDLYTQYPGSGWTMAGIVSSMCGVPLKGPGGVTVNNEATESMGTFMQGATCLGDVLASEGYIMCFCPERPEISQERVTS